MLHLRSCGYGYNVTDRGLREIYSNICLYSPPWQVVIELSL